MNTRGATRQQTDLQPSYPKRPQYFAMKFLRILFQSGAAKSIGRDGIALLTTTVVMEDQKPYREPADYWGSQLQSDLGCNDKTLKRIRDELIKSGWLKFQSGIRGSRRRPSIYWVDIPEPYRHLAEKHGIVNFTVKEALPDRRLDDSNVDSNVDSNDVLPNLRPKTLKPTCSELNSEQSDRLSKFSFPVVKNNGAEWPLPSAKLTEYRETYPGLDVESELRKARQWCRDTPAKRKTPGGMPAFLNRWFDRAQNRGQSPAPNNPESRVATKEDAETWRP